jgi:hypothetical protein
MTFEWVKGLLALEAMILIVAWWLSRKART